MTNAGLTWLWRAFANRMQCTVITNSSRVLSWASSHDLFHVRPVNNQFSECSVWVWMDQKLNVGTKDNFLFYPSNLPWSLIHTVWMYASACSSWGHWSALSYARKTWTVEEYLVERIHLSKDFRHKYKRRLAHKSMANCCRPSPLIGVGNQ